ncbi:MAG: pilus assembly protein PilP [Kangiellaceae bacterium]|jgi:type IV pilus assembly protein PilP|nr:pilus assembly protein PilP [Kangiellaceae bacterium]|tara:strand:- start:45239 stop:45772 length:534 start_codon:yes stop_codon:yes gene_type:complete
MNVKMIKVVTLLGLSVLFTGCLQDDMSDLKSYVSDIKKRPGGPIPKIPEIKTFPGFEYAASDLRSPFVHNEPEEQPLTEGGPTECPHPDKDRPKEELERFEIDTLAMAGTVSVGDGYYGLVKDKEGIVYKVQVSNHLGRNNGMISEITETTIDIVEIVPDGKGCWKERLVTLTLAEE